MNDTLIWRPSGVCISCSTPSLNLTVISRGPIWAVMCHSSPTILHSIWAFTLPANALVGALTPEIFGSYSMYKDDNQFTIFFTNSFQIFVQVLLADHSVFADKVRSSSHLDELLLLSNCWLSSADGRRISFYSGFHAVVCVRRLKNLLTDAGIVVSRAT